jgi:hypothetical protein
VLLSQQTALASRALTLHDDAPELLRTEIGDLPSLNRFFVDAAGAAEDFQSFVTRPPMEFTAPLTFAPEG